MRPIIALLPSQEFIQKVYSIRQQLVLEKIGNKDSREQVLPHITTGYFQDELSEEKINLLKELLNQIKLPSISFTFYKFDYWQNKISGMINSSEIDNLAKTIEEKLIRFNIFY